jgi:hypothetical protein
MSFLENHLVMIGRIWEKENMSSDMMIQKIKYFGKQWRKKMKVKPGSARIMLISLMAVASLFIPYRVNADNWGERYLFEDKQGGIKPFLVCTRNTRGENVPSLHLIQRIDTDNLIITTFVITAPFDFNFFVIPSFVSSWGKYIRHITKDVYDIDGEYVTMIKAPKGFWTDAYLDAGR